LIVDPPAFDDLIAPACVINFVEPNLGALAILIEHGIMVECPGRGIFRIEKEDIEVALPALL